MKNKIRKIFCQDCAHERDRYCDHPKNMRDDYFGPKHAHAQTAEYINQNNDCPWFRRYQATDIG